ncbi:Tolloid-like protein 1 [Aphelenchoides bicaudatus]|nr:Tolloid-like protein 1 [Aphelenchoides bicaudatus]
MQSRQIVYWLVACLLTQMVNAQNGPQPCPENPIVLTGSDFGQSVYSPYNEERKYPPNTDCRFILVARTLQRRIHISIIESQLEEPLFTDCKDYVSVRDGSQPTSQEIIRWCGSNSHPPAISSSGDTLYIHFHSDSIISARGFNLSFVDFEGCPPDWIVDADAKYCYRLFDSAQRYTFVDAQRVCSFERANLLTIESSKEYDFIYNQYSGSNSFPWIGYNDANKEGVFDPIDPNVQSWPESFPAFKSDHSDKDCIYLDWNVREGIAHTIGDCRDKRSLICKKRHDGTTIPIHLPSTFIRYGFQTSSFNYTLLLIILIIILVMLIILWIIYQKCKRTNTVEAVNRNQRAPIVAETSRRSSEAKAGKSSENDRTRSKSTTSKTKTSSTEAKINTQHQPPKLHFRESTKKEGSINENNRRNSTHAYNGSNSPRIKTHPNQALPQEFNSSQDLTRETRVQMGELAEASRLEQHNVQQRDSNLNMRQTSKDEDEPPTPRLNQPPDRSHLYMENDERTIKVLTKSQQQHTINNGSTPLHSVLAPVGEPTREHTNLTGLSSTRSRGTQVGSQNFERPHVGPLDNVSAISLDEFWQRN